MTRICRVTMILVCAAGVMVGRQPEVLTLTDFALRDQFGRMHRHTDYRGRIVVVIGSDRHAREYNPQWGAVLRDSLRSGPGFDRIAFLPVADLRGTPFFLRGYVKRQAVQKSVRGVLLDWEGYLAKYYNFEPKAANILIFDSTGGLVYRTHGRAVEAEKLGRILAELRGILQVSRDSSSEAPMVEASGALDLSVPSQGA